MGNEKKRYLFICPIGKRFLLKKICSSIFKLGGNWDIFYVIEKRDRGRFKKMLCLGEGGGEVPNDLWSI